MSSEFLNNYLLPEHDDILYPPELEPEGPGCILVIAGPPGGGKDTLMHGLLADPFLRFQKEVTYATRGPRPGEIPGYDYRFVSQEELFRMKSANMLAETAPTGDTYKGTSKDIFQGIYKGKKSIWRIDASRTAVLPEWLQKTFPGDADFIQSRLNVLTVMPSDLKVVYERAAKREGITFNGEKFHKRVEEEMYYIRNYPHMFQNVIYNDTTPEDLVQNGLVFTNNWIAALRSPQTIQHAYIL